MNDLDEWWVPEDTPTVTALRPGDRLIVLVPLATNMDRAQQIRDRLEAQGIDAIVIAGNGLVVVQRPTQPQEETK